MNQIKIGQFIAALRKSKNLTQEELGNKLGVTNKTISRWENGNYMPNIEMLQLLSKEFDITMNEILSGERLSEECFRQKADENILKIAKASVFTFEERKKYFIKKWRKEHIALLSLLLLIWLASIIIPIWIIDKPYLVGLSPLIGFIAYGYQNNKMMICVEHNLYD